MKQMTITLTGQPPMDGYYELLIGTFVLAGVLVSQKTTQTPLDNGQLQITVECVLRAAPLGHLGTDDLPKRK